LAIRIQYFPSPQPPSHCLARGLAIVLALVCAGLLLAARGAAPLTLAAQVIKSTFGSSFGSKTSDCW